jgi:hypothetical protein
MKKLSLFICCLLLLGQMSCDSSVHEEGNGQIRKVNRTVPKYSELEVSGEYTLVLRQGSAPRVEIETDENLLDYIETEVSGKTLRIRNTENIEGSDGIQLLVVYPELERLEVGGATKVRHEGTLRAKNLEVDVAGATMLELNLQVKKLELKLSGAGIVTLSGDAESQEVELSGAGSLDAYDLHTQKSVVMLSGVGSAEVFATEELEGEVSGIGSIRFKGNPRNIRREVGGLGSIESADDDTK